MSEKEKSTIESLADAIWSRAAKGASATFRNAIDDLAGIDESHETHRVDAEPKTETSERSHSRRMDDETLEELTVAGKKLLDFADRKYRDLMEQFMGEAGTDGTSARELKQLAEKLICSMLESDEPDGQTTKPDLKDGANSLASWLADAVSDHAFDVLGADRTDRAAPDAADQAAIARASRKPASDDVAD